MSCSINVLPSPGPVGILGDKSAGRVLPRWVSPAVRHYLAHTECGTSIRALARTAHVHASTVMRQVRKLETQRDDPLIDAALRHLAHARTQPQESEMSPHPNDTAAPAVSTAKLRSESARVLRRLSEPRTVLAIANGMELGVIVREDRDGAALRIGVVDQAVAQALALNEWVACADAQARIRRYHITSAGRAQLRDLTAQDENGALGFAEGQARFEGASPVAPARQAPVSDSPLAALARRKEKDGSPFLARELASAGERLREDFELAQMDGGQINWTDHMAGGAPAQGGTAGQRVAAALQALGPGLGDVALRCCCYLEGMEVIEKKMGWCARSGKVVLRIALIQLKRHYDDQGDHAQMIG